MTPDTDRSVFLDAFGIQSRHTACLIGAGGKTSLMFLLAEEAREKHLKVLVTTSTKFLIPPKRQYDFLHIPGKNLFIPKNIQPGIHVLGVKDSTGQKLMSIPLPQLEELHNVFDILLIEGDGSARKPLKGWNKTEPVIPPFTTQTIGIVDIQTVGRRIDATLAHRLEIFLELTATLPGDILTTSHLRRLICHPQGLFGKSRGKRIVYINKVESEKDQKNAYILKDLLKDFTVVSGSLNKRKLHD